MCDMKKACAPAPVAPAKKHRHEKHESCAPAPARRGCGAKPAC